MFKKSNHRTFDTGIFKSQAMNFWLRQRNYRTCKKHQVFMLLSTDIQEMIVTAWGEEWQKGEKLDQRKKIHFNS